MGAGRKTGAGMGVSGSGELGGDMSATASTCFRRSNEKRNNYLIESTISYRYKTS